VTWKLSNNAAAAVLGGLTETVNNGVDKFISISIWSFEWQIASIIEHVPLAW
jgi:hypothetical protein